jgi:hypothetical protein
VITRPRTLTLATAAIVAAALATIPSAAQADPGTPVPLGAGATFAVLAGSGVTNTGATTLGGDIGTFPTTSITGPGTITLAGGGVDHGGDAVTQQAKTDLVVAYDAASSQVPDPLGGVELAGLTLEPGVYDTGGVIELNGNLTLDANGDPNAVFVFQSLSTLLAGAASSITFVDGATACNLYWRVPSSATILAGSRFAGTILALASITLEAGATLDGRALARTGAVTMITNTITLPACSPVPGVPAVAGPQGSSPAAGIGPQVPVSPRGGIATGDGSSLPAGPAAGPVLTALALLGLGTLALTVRSRRRVHG